MKLIDCSQPQSPIAPSSYRLCRVDGADCDVRWHLQHEHHLSIVVNGQLAFTLTCTPEHLPELAIGRLFSDGFIGSIDDIASLHSCQHGDVIKIALREDIPLTPERAISISTCNAAREAHMARRKSQALAPLEAQPFDRRWVFAAARAFAEDTPMHKHSRGAHSCFLAQKGHVLFYCEDLGRHNAFDKVIGWAMRQGVDLSRCFAITSGRVPTDMAAKAVGARIPVLLSASVPTDAAIALAREKGLTLIGRIKADSVAVFHDPTASMVPQASRAISAERFDSERTSA